MTVFDEKEIVAGDFVKVELDPEVFKMIHEAAGLWDDRLTAVNLASHDNEYLEWLLHRIVIQRFFWPTHCDTDFLNMIIIIDLVQQLLNQVALVLSILEGQRIFVTLNGDSFTVCSDAMSKVLLCFFLLRLLFCISVFILKTVFHIVTQLKHCLVGQTVRVINDTSLLQEVHSNRDIWSKAMFTVCGIAKTTIQDTRSVITEINVSLQSVLCIHSESVIIT